MKILVTGAAGFIGGNYVHYIVEKYPEDEVVALDKLTYAGNLETLEPVMDKIKFVKEDICNREAIFKLFEEEKFDVVVNFAAESHVDRSIEDPEVFLNDKYNWNSSFNGCFKKIWSKKIPSSIYR